MKPIEPGCNALVLNPVYTGRIVTVLSRLGDRVPMDKYCRNVIGYIPAKASMLTPNRSGDTLWEVDEFFRFLSLGTQSIDIETCVLCESELMRIDGFDANQDEEIVPREKVLAR